MKRVSSDMATRWRRTIGRAVIGLALVAATAIAGLEVAVRSMPPPPLLAADQLSTVVLDRHGQLLRAFTTPHGLWRLPVDPADVDQRYIRMLLAFEDHRYHTHYGVDPMAVGRAAWLAVRHGRIVSGGSTLTMQVARLLDSAYDKSAATKLHQMIRALQVERRLDKQQILRLYLRLAPFGGNLEGVRAASLAYFGKEPRRLSVAEAALLVALPQSPGTRRPDRFHANARRARDRVLARAQAAGVISLAQAEHARREPVPASRAEFPRLAPHLAESEVARLPGQRVHILTVERDLQASIERLARDHARARGERLSAAILVLDNATGDVLAHVGSADYLDGRRLGAIDMTSAVRSPGSTLKPLIYGMAFESGLAHPETLIEDRPARFGSYAPKNFDDTFHGTITVRHALATSLNIPAVKLLNRLGPGRLIGRLRRGGARPVLPGGAGEEAPTLAVALGGLGLTLHDLAAVYVGLARGGEPLRLGHVRAAGSISAGAVGAGPTVAGTSRPTAPLPSRRLLSPLAAWYVTDILKDAPPPSHAPAGRIAYKTGTSYGYRDAWAVGYDGRNTIAVWIGRADGSSTPGLTGHAAAAPMLFDAFQRAAPARTALPPAPQGILRVAGDTLPAPLKRFAETTEMPAANGFLDPPVQIAFPPDRAEVEVPDAGTPVVLKAEGGALPLTWLVDGAPLPAPTNAREVMWLPGGLGFVRLSVIDAKGRVDRVTVRLR